MTDLIIRNASKSIPITLLTEKNCTAWIRKQPARVAQWLKSNEFSGKPGSLCIIPGEDGKTERVAAGISDPASLWDIADFSRRLPPTAYHLDWDGSVFYQEWIALGWALGGYRFMRYKKSVKALAQLVAPKKSDLAKIKRYADAICRGRDLINTPAEDMGPAELAAAIAQVGKKYRARVTQIKGDELLRKNFPAIHIVGRASSRAPRLVDLTWGNPKHPKVTLVGKGVCFDTGGLDIKPSGAMYYMKKDMGGAATALAIAEMTMNARLPVRLRLLVPAVENSISGNAFRPTDIIRMRNGLTVEVGNTDAEGRLVLADTLTAAMADNPRYVFDFSTLTGAARTALGTDLPALFCNDDKMAEGLLAVSTQMEDAMWRMPLHNVYEKMLDSPIADLNSAPNSPYAGAITAALFLRRFVNAKISWAHLDMMAWNPSSKSGRPEGGEAMAARAVFRFIETQIRPSRA